MRKTGKKSRGQTIVEYILIITLVAIASLVVLGIFSDRVRTIIAGVASTFGAEDAEEAVEQSSVEILQEMDASGLELEEGGE